MSSPVKTRHRRPRPLGQSADPRRIRQIQQTANRRRLQPLAGQARRIRQRIRRARRARHASHAVQPEIKGVILTVPNEQHLPLAEQVAKAGKHVYTEKPIAQTLEDGLKIEALEKQYGITVTVGHSARLMAGIRIIKEHIDRGDLGRVAFIEANFSNERALELTPQTWRWYKDRAPGGNLSQLCIHMFDVVHMLGGPVTEISSMSSKLSPVGAEVDDQSMSTVRFADGKLGYVGSSWTSPGVFAVRVFGAKGLMHYEIDFGTWDTPHLLHNERPCSTSSAARTAGASGRNSPCPKATCSVPSWKASPTVASAAKCRNSPRTTATSQWRWSTRRCARSTKTDKR